MLKGWICLIGMLVGVHSKLIDPMRHEITLVTPQTLNSILNRQREALLVTYLIHYSEKAKSHEQYITQVYNEAAKSAKGMMKFLAIDCHAFQDFCEKTQQVDAKTPTVFVYSPNPIIPPEKLGTNETKDSLIRTGVKYIPGEYIQTLSEETFKQFILLHPAIPKVVLFSTKETVPVMFKALSNAFKDRINFGLIPSNVTGLDKTYNVKARPAALLFKGSVGEPIVYKGEFKYPALHAWINIYAETFVKGGGFVEKDVIPEQINKSWLLERLPEITGKSFNDLCVKSNSMCLMYLTNGNLTKDEITMLHSIMDDYGSTSERGPSFRWTWMNLALETGFSDLFKVDPTSFPSIVALNTHKPARFFLLPKEKKANPESIRYFVERIISGDGRFTIIKGGKLPSFSSSRTQPSSTNNGKDEL